MNKNNSIPNEYLINYLDSLISRIYKCLPMRENSEITLNIYMKSLLRELIGNKKLIKCLGGSPIYLSILGKIEYLIDNNVKFNIYRKEIFDCISLVEKLKSEVKEHS